MIDTTSRPRAIAAQAITIAALLLGATGCACGPCQPGQEDEEKTVVKIAEPEASPREARTPGLETWSPSDLRSRVVGADWEIEGDCKTEGERATCKASREGMKATITFEHFDTDKDARARIKTLEGAETATRDGNALLIAAVDVGGAARALFDDLMAGKDPAAINLTDFTVRDIRGVLKRTGWKSGGKCEKENVPTSRTTICRASRAGLDAEIRYRKIPGAPHESNPLRVGKGVAELDQADVSLKVIVTDDNTAETLLSDIQD